MTTLDAGSVPPKGVAPQPVLRILVGNPAREMLILSGIAFPDWSNDSGRLVHDELVIRLGVATTPRFEASATVALAAIYNTDSDFIFAADDASVVPDSDGQLELHVPLGLMGEKSVLLKLSYHVQVLSDPLESLVSGTIRWAEALGAPTLAAQAGAPALFRVAAGLFVAGPSGGNSLGTTQWQERSATFSGPPKRVSGMWAAPYVIRGLALNERLQILPQYLGGLVRPASNELSVFSPNRAVLLTPAVPALTGVDFELSFQPGGPR